MHNQAGYTRNVKVICTVFLNDPSSRRNSANHHTQSEGPEAGFNFSTACDICNKKTNLYWLNTEASTKYPAVSFSTRLKITEGHKYFFSNTQI